MRIEASVHQTAAPHRIPGEGRCSMKFDRKRLLIQLSLVAVVATALIAFAPVAPAAKLATAITYTYHRVLPNIASDGLP